MESGTQAALIMGLTTIVFPLLSGLGLSWLLSKKANLPQSASLIALSLSLLTAFCGILSWGQLWGVDAIRFLFWLPLLLAWLWKFTQNLTQQKEEQTQSSLALQVLKSKDLGLIGLIFVSVYMLSSPLAGLWRDGITKALLNEPLVMIAVLVWFSLNMSLEGMKKQKAVEAVHFALISLCFAFGSPIIGLSGSASLAQLFAAFGLAIAGVGIAGLLQWILLTRSTYIMAYFSLFSALLYALFYLSSPLSLSLIALFLLVPILGRYVSAWALTPFKQTLIALLIALPLLTLALGLVASKALQEQDTQSEVDDFGASY